MRTVEEKVCSFDELSDDAKQKALDHFRDFNVEYEDWYHVVYENFIEQAGKEGFDVENIYFSGFWSQGDGAMFEYRINDKIFNDFVDSLDLSPMRKEWVRTQVYASAKGVHNRGYYYHEKSCDHSIYWELNGDVHYSTNLGQWLLSFDDDFEEFVINRYNDLCYSLYQDLEAEYEYLTSDDCVSDMIRANEYEFYEDGTQF